MLLNWFEGACRKTGRIHIVRLSPSRIRTGQDRDHLLLPMSVINRILPKKPGVTGVCQAVGCASSEAIDAALATTGADSATRLAAREELNHLGYIWSPPGQLPPIVWLAGVPSLMTHILERAPLSHD
ncbi:MAG: hypothetical protein OXC31_01190 [Spirochaetaceae bacterium]|nr:hypothetical protein [Spirochaetaceae bacterium]